MRYAEFKENVAASIIASMIKGAGGNADAFTGNISPGGPDTDLAMDGNKIAVVGDSIAVGIGSVMKDAVTNALVGAGSSAILARISNEVKGADLAIISAGSNDIVKGQGDPKKLASNLQSIKSALGAKKYVWILPYDKIANQVVKSIAGSDATIDLSSYPSNDQVHPSGYGAVAKAAAAFAPPAKQKVAGGVVMNTAGKKETVAMLSKEAASQGVKGKELAAFLAQCYAESAFTHLSEIWGPTSAQKTYQGRMGNNQPGDGYKYRGRGFIGLTGKENYTNASRSLGINLVKDPDAVSKPDIAAKTSLWFWMTYVHSKISNWDDTVSVTQLVNGGQNGIDTRKQAYATFRQQVATA